MRRTAISALALPVVLLASPIAFAIQVQPSASINVDGQHYDVPVTQSADGKTYEVGGSSGYQLNVPGEYFISLGGQLDPDPQIDFGFSITDFGAPSNFNFNFFTPITLPGGPNVVYSSISGGLNDVTSNGASITPTLADFDGDTFPELMVNDVGGPATNMGVDTGLGMTLPPGTSGTQTYGAFNAGPQAGPLGPWSSLTSTVAFTASGGGDIFSATGHAEINVPEPASLGLLALAAVPALRRRRA